MNEKFVVVKNCSEEIITAMANGNEYTFPVEGQKVLPESVAKILVLKTAELVNYDQVKSSKLKILNKGEIDKDILKGMASTSDDTCIVKNFSETPLDYMWNGVQYFFPVGGLKVLNRTIANVLRLRSLTEGKYLIDYAKESDIENIPAPKKQENEVPEKPKKAKGK